MNIRFDLELIGKKITLSPLTADDFEALATCASNPEVWAQHPDSKRYQRERFKTRFFDGAAASESAYTIINTSSGNVVGSTRFYDFKPEHREIAIGYTFLACEEWGTGANTEMKDLMINFIAPYVDKIWFHIGSENHRSRRAVEKLGATFQYEEDEVLEGLAYTKCYYLLELEKYKQA